MDFEKTMSAMNIRLKNIIYAVLLFVFICPNLAYASTAANITPIAILMLIANPIVPLIFLFLVRIYLPRDSRLYKIISHSVLWMIPIGYLSMSIEGVLAPFIITAIWCIGFIWNYLKKRSVILSSVYFLFLSFICTNILWKYIYFKAYEEVVIGKEKYYIPTALPIFANRYSFEMSFDINKKLVDPSNVDAQYRKYIFQLSVFENVYGNGRETFDNGENNFETLIDKKGEVSVWDSGLNPKKAKLIKAERSNMPGFVLYIYDQPEAKDVVFYVWNREPKIIVFECRLTQKNQYCFAKEKIDEQKIYYYEMPLSLIGKWLVARDFASSISIDFKRKPDFEEVIANFMKTIMQG